jgi:NAD-dependent dihydropyrimidine dehydrogenase PreA subunit
MQLLDHPTVRRVREWSHDRQAESGVAPLDAGWLKQLARECGADDAGLVEIGRRELDSERGDILRVFPRTKTLLAFVCRMNREPIRSPARSVSNAEFHHAGEDVNAVARAIVSALQEKGIEAVNPTMGFPMEMDRFPGKVWVVGHKPVAVAAGLGRMGIHRNVIHPRFGNFILLGTVLLYAEATAYDQPIDYNPCLECKLCVAACPVGAISADGRFDFSACYTHNYREFMGGFNDWVEQIADSRNGLDYRRRVSESESSSMWQSLSFGANYKAAYCLAVCPAGEDVIRPFLDDRGSFVKQVVRPLQDKEETVYVVAGSDAEAYVEKRFPAKRTKRVRNGIHARSIDGFLRGLDLTFQRNRSSELDAVFHFTFTGEDQREATVTIKDKALRVEEGHQGNPDLQVFADTATWLGFLAKERSLLWALLSRKIRIKGSPRLLVAFGRCFPS